MAQAPHELNEAVGTLAFGERAHEEERDAIGLGRTRRRPVVLGVAPVRDDDDALTGHGQDVVQIGRDVVGDGGADPGPPNQGPPQQALGAPSGGVPARCR